MKYNKVPKAFDRETCTGSLIEPYKAPIALDNTPNVDDNECQSFISACEQH